MPQDLNDATATQLLARIKAEREQQKPVKKQKSKPQKIEPTPLSLDGL